MKQSSLFKSLLCGAALACSYALAPLSAQNLVADPGFEASADSPTSNPFSSAWTVVEPNGFSVVGGNPAVAHAGNNYANLAPAVGAIGSLSQVLNTTAGGVYSLSFWLANNTDGGPNSFEVLWNGASVYSVTNVPNLNYINVPVDNLVASGAATTLDFRYNNDDDFFRLDDISVIQVPEAGTVSLALLGLGLLGAWQFRKAKRS